MIYITGDTHGAFERVKTLCRVMHTTNDDTLVILGDAGINFNDEETDRKKKEILSSLPITVFAIQGNHDMRPAHRDSYRIVDYRGGKVWVEENYPNILFARDGDIYNFDGYKCLVVGGAYSVDKLLRIKRGWPWFEDEMPDEEIKKRTEQSLEACSRTLDYVFSHTTPYKLIPRDSINNQMQTESWWSTDNSTEWWLQDIYDSITLRKLWYAGHMHVNKRMIDLQILFEYCTILGADVPFDVYDEIRDFDGVRAVIEINDRDGNLYAKTINLPDEIRVVGNSMEQVGKKIRERTEK